MSPPAFLSGCPEFHRYLVEVPLGSVTLQPYEQTANGIRVYHGEIFCRVARCAHGTAGFSATNNLRGHLHRHTLVVAPTPSGRLTQSEVDRTLAWYMGLFQGHEDDDDDKDEEDDDEEEGDSEENEKEDEGADEVQEDEEVEDDQ
ncbi:unnamed protein product [Penicillium bialowiezense]